MDRSGDGRRPGWTYNVPIFLVSDLKSRCFFVRVRPVVTDVLFDRSEILFMKQSLSFVFLKGVRGIGSP